MYIRSLGYVGVEVSDLPAYRHFFGPLTGAEVHDDDGGLLVRVDAWERRFLVRQGAADDVSFFGWEVGDATALARMRDRVPGTTPLTADELAWRGVEAGAWCLDPDGVRTEFFHGPRLSSPFSAPLGTSFLTGETGLGHVVLATGDLAAATAFYEDLLGFRLSDSACLGAGAVVVRFLRCNPRHHSLALAGVPSPRHCQHLMVEATDLDSVGRAYDRFRAAEAAQTGIGRHSNDRMFSFYALSPSGFTLEYGWGGDLIGAGPHVPSVFDRESTWGHEELIATGTFG
jgi:2,3-dihydroxybiphenyl 1,2-dioxygenase